MHIIGMTLRAMSSFPGRWPSSFGKALLVTIILSTFSTVSVLPGSILVSKTGVLIVIDMSLRTVCTFTWGNWGIALPSSIPITHVAVIALSANPCATLNANVVLHRLMPALKHARMMVQPTMLILRRGNRFQMRGVNAGAISAKVIKVHSFRNIAYGKLPRDPVNRLRVPVSPPPEHGIPCRINVSFPCPTGK